MRYLIYNEIGFLYVLCKLEFIYHDYKKLYKTINRIKKYNTFKIFISLKLFINDLIFLITSFSQKLHSLLFTNVLIVFNFYLSNLFNFNLEKFLKIYKWNFLKSFIQLFLNFLRQKNILSSPLPFLPYHQWIQRTI